jgi:uncharacterized protein
MFRSMWVSFLTVALVALSAASPSFAATDPEAVRLSKALLEATHAAEGGDQMTSRAIEMFSGALNEANPGRGPQIADLLNQVVAPEIRAALPGMYDATAQAFAANFSVEELKQLLAFYQSDVGRKFVERQSEIYRVQAEAGQAMMGRVEQKLIQAVDARGLRRPQL